MLMLLLTISLVAAVAGVSGYAAYRWPGNFQPYSETLRNVSLLAGVMLLVWNLAIAVALLAFDSAGLLVAGGYHEAKRIEAALLLVGPVTVFGTFGSAWLYLALLDYCVSAPRIAASASA